MRAAVVALACLLRFAVPALAAEPLRSDIQPASTGAATPVADPTGAEANATKVAPPHDTAKPPHLDDPRRDAGHARVCFNAAQTRETVASHRLAEPFRALRVGGQQGEALRAKLCRWKQDEWVYEISVLRRDGRIVHLYMNAQNGQAVGSLDSNDRH